MTGEGVVFPGTFPDYTASIIAAWQVANESDKLAALAQDLLALGLTWKVVAVRQNDAQVELQVGRLPLPNAAANGDLVSLAEVGLGVSQTLPVLVALQVA